MMENARTPLNPTAFNPPAQVKNKIQNINVKNT